MKIQVLVTETLSRKVEVEADSYDDAASKVREMYNKEEIVLDDGDYEGVEFEPLIHVEVL